MSVPDGGAANCELGAPSLIAEFFRANAKRAHSRSSSGLPHALPGLGAVPPTAVLATSKLLYCANLVLSPAGVVSWSTSPLQRTRVPLVLSRSSVDFAWYITRRVIGSQKETTGVCVSLHC